MIRLTGVEKTLGGQPVLQGIDLSIPVGKLTTIIGGSGSGKSVLLKHMIGLMQPDRGEVWVGDVEISRLSGTRLNDVRKQFAMLFQGAALFDSLPSCGSWSDQRVSHDSSEEALPSSFILRRS